MTRAEWEQDKTVTENDRESRDSWDDGARQHVDERTAWRAASVQWRCEFWRSQTRSMSDVET